MMLATEASPLAAVTNLSIGNDLKMVPVASHTLSLTAHRERSAGHIDAADRNYCLFLFPSILPERRKKHAKQFHEPGTAKG